MSFFKGLLHIADGRWIGQAVLGKKVASQIDLAGQIVGDYNKLYRPAKVAPIPGVNVDASAYAAGSIFRRLVAGAQGIDSTIRTGPQGIPAPLTVPYAAAPKRLLGS